VNTLQFVLSIPRGRKEMKKSQRGATLVELIVVVVFLLGAGGWVTNIVKFAKSDFDGPVTPRIVLRGVGIPVVPLGAVMGYL
jgi:hypothetical protein